MKGSTGARTLVLALSVLLFRIVASAQMSVTCSGSLTFNNMLPGHSSTHTVMCYAAGLPSGTVLGASMEAYLTSLPVSGSSTIPAESIKVSPNNATFTAFGGIGPSFAVTLWSGGTPPNSFAPQNVYLQIAAPANQPPGQYSGVLTVQVDVNYTP